MTQTILPATVRRSVLVNAGIERAFEVFTASIGTWWPRSHKIGGAAMVSAAIEPRAGGRWYEIGEDGSECQWGEVLAWEPPQRLLLAWRIGTDWKYNPDLLTEVEVKFTSVDGARTEVALEHRKLENMGASAEETRAIFDSEGGWLGILANFQAVVAANADKRAAS